MYFLPRTNKIFSWLAHRSITHLYIGSFLTLILISFCWFFFVYTTIDAKIEQAGVRLRQLQNQKIELTQAQTAHEKLEKRLALLEKDFALLAKDSALQAHISAALPQIISAAQLCKLGLKNCALENQTDGQWYTQTQVAVAAQGTMDQIKQFFSHLHKSGHMVKITNLGLTHEAQGVYNMQLALGFITIKNS